MTTNADMQPEVTCIEESLISSLYIGGGLENCRAPGISDGSVVITWPYGDLVAFGGNNRVKYAIHY